MQCAMSRRGHLTLDSDRLPKGPLNKSGWLQVELESRKATTRSDRLGKQQTNAERAFMVQHFIED